MVNLCSDGIQGLISKIGKKKLICFGAGKHFDTIMNLYSTYQLWNYVNYIVDNNKELYNTYREYYGKQFKIISLNELKAKEKMNNVVLLVSCHLYSMDIVSQLDSDEDMHGVDVYVGSFISDEVKLKSYMSATYNKLLSRNELFKIPKMIHYCWFGKSDTPQEYQEYMVSWKKMCPDYEIIRWDESNFDITQNKYMYEAYQQKKWAFVSDYARIKILYEYGGIYLDCDVELMASLDNVRNAGFYCGFENRNHIALGLGCGAMKGHPYLKRLLDYYEQISFINEDKSLNMTPCTAYQTKIIKEFGVSDENSFQIVDDIVVYPTEVFAPISPWGEKYITENTISIHHYGASWQTKDNMERIQDMYHAYKERIDKQ